MIGHGYYLDFVSLYNKNRPIFFIQLERINLILLKKFLSFSKLFAKLMFL